MGIKTFPVKSGEFFEKHYKPVLGNAKQVSGYLFWRARLECFHTFKKTLPTLLDWNGRQSHRIMAEVLGQSFKRMHQKLVRWSKS